MYTIELEKINSNEDNSFSCRQYRNERFEHTLHIHKELEIVYICSGEGECIVADSHTPFSAGDIFLFGGYLPHHFKSNHDSPESNSIYIQFLDSILPSDYSTMLGCISIKQLIQSSNRGVKFKLESQNRASSIFKKMLKQSGYSRLISLYDVLNYLGERIGDSTPIASQSYTITQNTSDNTYHQIIEYINLHYADHITLAELASYAHMNSSAMCRYFKNKAGQSIFDYISDVRIAIAKEELATTDTPIVKIAYEVGYSSISNFNAQFKRSTQLTPSEYRARVK